jgi:hypothetical protein
MIGSISNEGSQGSLLVFQVKPRQGLVLLAIRDY